MGPRRVARRPRAAGPAARDAERERRRADATRDSLHTMLDAVFDAIDTVSAEDKERSSHRRSSRLGAIVSERGPERMMRGPG